MMNGSILQGGNLQSFNMIQNGGNKNSKIRGENNHTFFGDIKFWMMSHRFLFLCFRLAGQCSKINKHFTQNICDHLTVRQIIYDPEIQCRYKIPFSAHLRSDKEASNEENILYDYLNWIGEILSMHSQQSFLDNFGPYL